MHLIARLLGLAAAIGNRTSRFSINGFQLNWLLLVALGVGVSFTSRELHYAMQNSAEPSVLRVNQASSSESFVGSFVKVVGTLYAEPLFTRERTRRGSPPHGDELLRDPRQGIQAWHVGGDTRGSASQP